MTPARTFACLSVFLLGACGADPAPEPVEQIIVRQPDAPPVAIAAADVATAAPTSKPAGQVAGFAYSDALKASGIIWTTAELDSFIAGPAAKIPGTTMMAGPMVDAAKRQAVIAFLESTNAS